jgi:hypothetical protein
MGYLIVVAFSVLVGGGVYAATLRAAQERPAAVGFDGPGDPDGDRAQLEAPGPGYTYLRVATRGLSWQDRVAGFVGLVILVFVGATVLAFGIYQLGHLVNLTIERFLES